MSVLYLLPVGSPDPSIIEELGQKLQEQLGWEIRRAQAMKIPVSAFNAVRGQYEALHLMRAIAETMPNNVTKILAVSEEDISIPMLTFVFGQAQLNGKIALMSLARLKQEFYGMPENTDLLRIRTWKEALHELGHTFGLTHCPTQGCIMTLANDIQHVDEKRTEFCGGCSTLFTDARRAAELNATKEQL